MDAGEDRWPQRLATLRAWQSKCFNAASMMLTSTAHTARRSGPDQELSSRDAPSSNRYRSSGNQPGPDLGDDPVSFG